MMKAYLITSGEYSSYHVDYVTMDKEKAKKFVMLDRGKNGLTNYDIEEYELDNFSIETNNVEKYLHAWDIYFTEGAIMPISKFIETSHCRRSHVLIPKDTLNTINKKVDKYTNTIHYQIFIYLDENDVIKAGKIATDMLSKKLSEDLGL